MNIPRGFRARQAAAEARRKRQLVSDEVRRQRAFHLLGDETTPLVERDESGEIVATALDDQDSAGQTADAQSDTQTDTAAAPEPARKTARKK